MNNCDHIVGTWDKNDHGNEPGELAKLSRIPPGRGYLDIAYEFHFCPECGKDLSHA